MCNGVFICSELKIQMYRNVVLHVEFQRCSIGVDIFPFNVQISFISLSIVLCAVLLFRFEFWSFETDQKRAKRLVLMLFWNRFTALYHWLLRISLFSCSLLPAITWLCGCTNAVSKCYAHSSCRNLQLFCIWNSITRVRVLVVFGIWIKLNCIRWGKNKSANKGRLFRSILLWWLCQLAKLDLDVFTFLLSFRILLIRSWWFNSCARKTLCCWIFPPVSRRCNLIKCPSQIRMCHWATSKAQSKSFDRKPIDAWSWNKIRTCTTQTVCVCVCVNK